jgi:methionyl aminopeptidase
MMIHKTDAEIALMKEAATLVSKTLTEVAKVLKPGMTTLQIDTLCAEFIGDHKAIRISSTIAVIHSPCVHR